MNVPDGSEIKLRCVDEDLRSYYYAMYEELNYEEAARQLLMVCDLLEVHADETTVVGSKPRIDTIVVEGELKSFLYYEFIWKKDSHLKVVK